MDSNQKPPEDLEPASLISTLLYLAFAIPMVTGCIIVGLQVWSLRAWLWSSGTFFGFFAGGLLVVQETPVGASRVRKAIDNTSKMAGGVIVGTIGFSIVLCIVAMGLSLLLDFLTRIYRAMDAFFS